MRGSARGALGNWRPYRDQRCEPMNKNRIGGLRWRAKKPVTTKPISIKPTGGKSVGCASARLDEAVPLCRLYWRLPQRNTFRGCFPQNAKRQHYAARLHLL
jgi:hypothetical protein